MKLFRASYFSIIKPKVVESLNILLAIKCIYKYQNLTTVVLYNILHILFHLKILFPIHISIILPSSLHLFCPTTYAAPLYLLRVDFMCIERK